MKVFLPLLFLPALLSGQAPFTPPDYLDHRKAYIWSEGTRMAAELFSPQSQAGKKLPTILMSHGWGGVVANLRPDAVAFARAGYLAVAFDYRGWGASDSRVILTGPPPAERPNNRFTAAVQEVREVVDPIDQTTDLLNALHWVQGEPRCDVTRIGLWGSSYSGGHVVYAAARDPRVKALVSQVGSLDSSSRERGLAYQEATQRARGEIGYPAPAAPTPVIQNGRQVGMLRGAPIRHKMLYYAPVLDTGRAPQCAMLFVIAENEELFDNRDHALRAYQLAKGPKKLVTIPQITHYGVYREARQEAQKLAVEWFDKHLATSPE